MCKITDIHQENLTSSEDRKRRVTFYLIKLLDDFTSEKVYLPENIVHIIRNSEGNFTSADIMALEIFKHEVATLLKTAYREFSERSFK